MCSAANNPGDIVASGGSPFRYETIRVWDQALVISTAGRAFLRPQEKKTSREEICRGSGTNNYQCQTASRPLAGSRYLRPHA